MAAEQTSTPLTDDEELRALLATDEEAWEAFDGAVRARLGVSGREFLRGVRKGTHVNDDSDSAITELFMLMGVLSEEQLKA